MQTQDWIAVAGLLGIVLAPALFHRRSPLENETDLLVARRRFAWHEVALSGSVAAVDVAGMVWIIAGCVAMGVATVWIAGAWGGLGAAMLAAYGARCLRRSNALTAVEWTFSRFGRSGDASAAHAVSVFVHVLLVSALAGLAANSLGLLWARACGVSPLMVSVLALVVAALGATVLRLPALVAASKNAGILLHLLCAAIAFTTLALVGPLDIAMAVPRDWSRAVADWSMLAGRTPSDLEPLAIAAAAFFVLGLLVSAGEPHQPCLAQRLLSTVLVRDACLAGLGWALLLAVRWAGYMGIAVLLLVGGDTTRTADHSTRLLSQTLGLLPDTTGLPFMRGLLLGTFSLALLAALISMLHAGASLYVGVYHASPLLANTQGHLSHHILLRLHRAGCAVAGASTLAFILTAPDYASVLRWLGLVIIGGMAVPNLLRWFWWRYSAWGYFGGLVYALVLPTLVALFPPPLPYYCTVGLVFALSLPVNLVPAWLTTPPTIARLKHFYRTVQPAGFWSPVRNAVREEEPGFVKRIRSRHDVLNAFLFAAGCVSLYFAAVLVLGQDVPAAMVAAGIALLCAATLYFTWYEHLPTE